MTRPTVYELEQLSRQKHPGKSYNWYNRYAKMASRIIGWELHYGGYQAAYKLDVVLLFVNEEDIVTRSPAKKQAIQDWRDEASGLIDFLETGTKAATEDGVDRASPA